MTAAVWVDYVQGVSAILTPLAVAWLGYTLTRRQSRNEVLVGARLDEYRRIVPNLNLLMCYMTFVGSWKTLTPPEVVELKRRLDRDFFVAAPLFSADVQAAYASFMDRCFETFNDWGTDARIVTSPYRRRDVLPNWRDEWDRQFVYDDRRAIPAAELRAVRCAYDGLVASMVRDLDITRARPRYTSDLVSLNAHAPRPKDVPGRSA